MRLSSCSDQLGPSTSRTRSLRSMCAMTSTTNEFTTPSSNPKSPAAAAAGGGCWNNQKLRRRLWAVCILALMCLYLPLLQQVSHYNSPVSSSSSSDYYDVSIDIHGPRPSMILAGASQSTAWNNNKPTTTTAVSGAATTTKTTAAAAVTAAAVTAAAAAAIWPADPKLCLVHVGKAGGVTLVRALLLGNVTTKHDAHSVAANAVNCMYKKYRTTIASKSSSSNSSNLQQHTTTTNQLSDKAVNTCFPSPLRRNYNEMSEITRRTLGVLHLGNGLITNDAKSWLLGNDNTTTTTTNVFLFTVRNPITRLSSAYYYHRMGYSEAMQQNKTRLGAQFSKFYKNCFASGFHSMIDTLRRYSSSNSNTTTSTTTDVDDDDDKLTKLNTDATTTPLECTKLGIDVLLGRIHNGGLHFEYNYEYYHEYTIAQHPNHAIAVIRTEYIWDDVLQLETKLGGSSNFSNVKGFKFTHGSENYTTTTTTTTAASASDGSTDISTVNSLFLCCLMTREIEYYQQLILLALNLSEEQKSTSLSELLTTCGVTTLKLLENDDKDDVLDYPPFSWLEFRQSNVCRGLLGNHLLMDIPTNKNNRSIAIVNNRSKFDLPTDPRLYLIHIGKAGGSTIKTALDLNALPLSVECMVKKENDYHHHHHHNKKSVIDDKTYYSSCYDYRPNSSQLQRRVLGYYHMEGLLYSPNATRWLFEHTNMFLFTIRDPIQRLISTFNYHRKQYTNMTLFPLCAAFYTKCFPRGMDSMLNDLQTGTGDDCMAGANTLLGKNHRGGDHFRFNYEYYWNFAVGQRPNHTVAVIRTEYMWEDIIQLDLLLGGNGNFGKIEGFKISHGSENDAAQKSTVISTVNTVFLCCLVAREIEYYQQMILKAVNLDDTQKRDSLTDLLNRCRVEISEDNVLEHPFSWTAFRQGKECRDRVDHLSDTCRSVDVSNSSNASSKLSENSQIYLIHIGKAGGSTLTRALNLAATKLAVECMVNKTHAGEDASSCYRCPPGTSELVRRIKGYFHLSGTEISNEGRSWLLNNTNVFLFTVRDPIERLISTYNYHKYEYRNDTLRRFYKHCFPEGFDQLVENLRNGTNSDCATMGVDALLGKTTKGGLHFQFDYRHYRNYTLGQKPNHTVAVIRTEYMWDDVIHLDQLLGGKGNFGKKEGFKFSHGSENYTAPHGTDISVSNTVFLCCLIAQEIEYYQEMILMAVNLDDNRKLLSLSSVMNRCGIDTTDEDVIKNPFSWQEFRQSNLCSDQLGTLVEKRQRTLVR